MTVNVKAMDSQRWICRTHLLQFNGNLFDKRRIGRSVGGGHRDSATDYSSAISFFSKVLRFFHRFKSKDALGVAAMEHWSETTGALFAEAPYHDHADPLDRVLGYVAFRKALLQGGVPEFTCLVGTMVQEIYETSPAIRDACDRSISGHAETLEADIEAAMRDRDMSPEWTTKSLALHTQAVLQGAFILAKAKGGAEIAADSIDHLPRYVELLFLPDR
jgi:TetR/AcrR family transcriptional repressor of nem operon